jgi:hypothetical protein
VVTSLSDVNCTATGADLLVTAVVTVNPRPTAAVSGATTICNGGSTNITITFTGTGPWNYQLNGGAVQVANSSPVIVSVSPASTTTYEVTSLSDANCTATAADLLVTATVTVNPRPTASISGTATICAGSSTNLMINFTGTGPWNFQINGGATQTANSSPALVPVSPASTTNYSVTSLSDANCTALPADYSGLVTITVNARPIGLILGSNTICQGQSINIFLIVSGSGTISGTLSDGTSFSGSAPIIAVNVSPTVTTTYTLATLSDANCNALPANMAGSSTITVNARPTAAITSGTTSICNGQSATITISATGNGTISGLLSDGTAFSGTAPTITVNVSPTMNTVYTIASLSDANCSSINSGLTGSATVTVKARPTAMIVGSTTICNGSSATLNIVVTGTGPWSGTLSNGASFSGASSPILVNVSPAVTTTYTVATLSDANLCGTIAGDISGSAVVTVNNHSTPSSYNVSSCNTYSLPWGPIVSMSGNYSHTYTNNAGCDSVVTANVTINSNSTPTSFTVNSCTPYTLPWGGLASVSGSYNHTYTNIAGCDSVVTANVTIGCVTLNVKLFIEGYYTGGGMMDNYGAGGCLFVNGISPNPTDADTIYISAMNILAPFALVEKKAAILHTNGTATVNFGPSVAVGSGYYFRIQHRNALETWSAPTVLTSTITTYDFTVAKAKAYGSNQIDVGTPFGGPPVWAIYSGDISTAIFPYTIGVQDGLIDSQDYSDMENAISIYLQGYVYEDITGDGIVESLDYSIIENNISNVITSLHP